MSKETPSAERVTFDDDFIVIGMIRPTLKSLGLTWPPPPFIEINNHGELPNRLFKRVRYSDITDEQRSKMTHVARGAEYLECSFAELPHEESEVSQ
jgi:hypothetical protein